MSGSDSIAATAAAVSELAHTEKARILLLGNKADMVLKYRGELLHHFCVLGHEVHVAAPDLPTSSVATTLRDWGVRLHHVELDRRSRNPFGEFASLRNIYQLCRDIAPSHLLAYTIKPSIYGPLAAKFAGVAQSFCIITGVGFIYSSEPKGFVDRAIRAVLRRFDRMAKSRCDAIFYQNTDDLELLQDRGVISAGARAVRIPGSGVNLESFAPAKTRAAPRANGPVFIMIARFLADKGIREYVAAAREIRARHPDAVFRLVGGVDINPEAILPDEIASWSDEIEVVDWVEDVRPYLADSDVFVLPSYREGTPRSVLEAMAMGLAIITTDAPGCKETIEDEVSGIFVQPRNTASLAVAMERFVDDRQLAQRMGAEARIRAEQVFDVNIVVDTIVRTMGLRDLAKTAPTNTPNSELDGA